jgi:hypothetical protein
MSAGSTLVRKPPETKRGVSKKRRAVYAELRDAAVRYEIKVNGTDPIEALQMCLDRAVEHWRVAMAAVDKIEEGNLFEDTINGKMPHHWFRLENQLRQEVTRLSAAMINLGIAERQVRVQEAQAMLLAKMVRDAAVEAGLPQEQVRALGRALREQAARRALPAGS